MHIIHNGNIVEVEMEVAGEVAMVIKECMESIFRKLGLDGSV